MPPRLHFCEESLSYAAFSLGEVRPESHSRAARSCDDIASGFDRNRGRSDESHLDARGSTWKHVDESHVDDASDANPRRARYGTAEARRPRMCTLIVAHRRIPGRPLVVAANRDEYLDRPSEGPRVRETRAGRVLAPLDLRAGGTWLGLNERGVFAALTNLRIDEPDPNRRSRGEVVLDALAEESAHGAARMLGRLETEAYNPFNLFVADARHAYVVVYRDRPYAQRLESGVHVIGNVEAAGPSNGNGNGIGHEKVRRIKREVDAALNHELDTGNERKQRNQDEPGEEAPDLLDRLAAICRSHAASERPPGARQADHAQPGKARRQGEESERSEPNAGSGAGRATVGDTCVHLGGTYGTRSSLLLELGEGMSGVTTGRLLHADGPPCRTVYEDVSPLLIELGQQPLRRPAEPLMRTAR